MYPTPNKIRGINERLPTARVRSNIFIERGKITVFEKQQRLGQINSIGDLELHGYGYYKVEKQP